MQIQINGKGVIYIDGEPSSLRVRHSEDRTRVFRVEAPEEPYPMPYPRYTMFRINPEEGIQGCRQFHADLVDLVGSLRQRGDLE
ncbi:hypothetical protein [Thioalkalivibrio sp. ALE16]|uniref:hypothetical protein n=1 Tax=Thioalkalivibrio sp. ALE16 TaxID=1158172 RepID=UPI0003645A89|nr:hypothetical protein [Thioalkalivibrio sp. ALE16]